MADVEREIRLTEDARHEMHQSDNPKHAALFAYDGQTGLLLAILQELREIKEELYTQSARTPDA